MPRPIRRRMRGASEMKKYRQARDNASKNADALLGRLRDWISWREIYEAHHAKHGGMQGPIWASNFAIKDLTQAREAQIQRSIDAHQRFEQERIKRSSFPRGLLRWISSNPRVAARLARIKIKRRLQTQKTK